MRIMDWLRRNEAATNKRLQAIETKLTGIETDVERLKKQSEQGLKATLNNAKDIKKKTDGELVQLRAQIAAQLQVLEKVIEGELNSARRKEVQQLVTRAKKIATRIDNQKIANDNPIAAKGNVSHG